MFLRGAGLSPAFCARLDSQALCLSCLKAGNCHNPYPDTVENGTTLRKSGIHDTQLDPKARNLTPKNRKFDSLRKARSDRLCRAK